MEKRSLLSRLGAVLLAVCLCVILAFWWAYVDLEQRHDRLSGDLEQARKLAGELANLRELNARMRADLKLLADRLIGEQGPVRPAPAETITDDIPVGALKRLAAMLDQQNRELAENLKSAETRVDELTKKLNLTQGQLNEATVSLARVQKELNGKTTTVTGLETRLTDLTKGLETSTAEGQKLKTDLAAAQNERSTLDAAKKKLEERVKNLSEAESEHGATIAALTQQVEDRKTQMGKLEDEVVKLKKEIEELKKKLTPPAE